MATYTTFPSFVRLDYHTAYAPHVQIIPTRQWLPTSITGVLGSYTTWNAGTIDAQTMIEDLIADIGPLVSSTTVYDLITVYNWFTEAGPPVPVASLNISFAGTSGSGGPAKATQFTFNIRTAGFQQFKLVMLDFPAGTGAFAKTFPSAFSADQLALFAGLTDADRAWSGRDNSRPNTPISITGTLNEALRKAYRMD